jgi:hypothetical protein
VFLTAAHCAEDGERVGVTFDADYQAGDKVYYGTFHADPAYPGPGERHPRHRGRRVRQGDQGHHARAAARGRVAVEPLVDAALHVGGLRRYKVEMGPGGANYVYNDVRLFGTGELNAINKTWLRISGNPSTGNINTCYGDSGGPNFLGDTNIVAAITITGDAVCRSTNVVYRLDTESARAFLGQYVTLP